ncbi:MAG TPA: hypothetical protein VFX49_06825, partial [Chloroflexota bacterium]|nr:hypothetical protein [Chloroflexota bacterium]
MTPASTASLVLPLAAPALVLVAAALLLWRRAQVAVAPLLLIALLSDAALAIGAEWLSRELGATERSLFTWSPLGLYGVAIGVRRTPDVALLTAPALCLAWLGILLASRRRRWFSALAEWSLYERASLSMGLAALAGAVWAPRAADYVSLFAGCAFFAAGCTGVLALVAGPAASGRRLVLGSLAAAALLSSGLVLGRVNGHFQLSGLSSAGFGAGAFAGMAVMAAFAGCAPPFHGWLLRTCRHPLAPALAAAGTACAAALLLV